MSYLWTLVPERIQYQVREQKPVGVVFVVPQNFFVFVSVERDNTKDTALPLA
jgi:hypothetical protein